MYRPQCCCCCCCYCCCYRRKHINAAHCLHLFTLKKVPSLPLWGFSLQKGEGGKKRKDLQQHNVRAKLRRTASRKLFLGAHEETPTASSQGKDNVRNRVATFLTRESEPTRERERERERAREKGNTCAEQQQQQSLVTYA